MAAGGSKPDPLIIVGLGATIALHGVLLAVILSGRANAQRVHRPQEFGQVVDVQAVKFGKPRDLSFLPHKEAPPTPRPKPKLALTENEHALPKLKNPNEPEKPAEEDPLKKVHKFDDNPTADPANTGTAQEEGDPNGLKGGNATEGKGAVYFQHVKAAVQNSWVYPPSLSAAALRRLKAKACIRIDAEGKVTESKIDQGSGNDRFDASLLDALVTVKQFDPPTSEKLNPGTSRTVKAYLAEQPLCLEFQKEDEQ